MPPSLGRLSDITIFRRGDDGILTERLQAAESATPLAEGWRLRAGHPGAGRRAASSIGCRALDWPGQIDIDRIQLLARPPRELDAASSCSRSLQRGRLRAAGARALPDLAHQRIAGAFVPMFLMMLAFALVRRFSRTASIAPVFMTAVAIGFSLLIMSGVASALGEVALHRARISPAGGHR